MIRDREAADAAQPASIPVCSVLLAGNERKYVDDCIDAGWISSSGRYVAAFERKFADWCGVRHGVAVTNGTAALHLALLALGVGPGDEVIIPDFTMIASAFAVCYAGGKPVFADADPLTWNVSPTAVAAKMTSRTKAIMAVHIFGNPCAMADLRRLAGEAEIPLVEDAAEAHGAVFSGRKAGALSDIAAFSFFANKNLTTGEGGMVLTDSGELAERCRYRRNLCFPAARTYLHDDIGFNYRMANIQAAIGLAQTEKADLYRAMRVRNGLRYRESLSGVPGLGLQGGQPGGESVFWMNGIRLEPGIYGRSREALRRHLEENGVETRLFFNGMHRQPALRKYGCDCSGAYPESDRLADNGLYLPSGSGLGEGEIARICRLIADFACPGGR
ncbi:MAG: DegT/DnrJ/EryC1/StrS family aminotransferase [Planctomycetota bacterium]|jgi:perosamine synthetase|nr:DegT/DnrJ/EryC1/StrS family aminotransferase [Planctomycetota bacterium]